MRRDRVERGGSFVILFSLACRPVAAHTKFISHTSRNTHTAINETLHAKPGEKEIQYKEEKVEQWSNTVMDKCLAKLAARESKYKYSVTCILMQKNGAGLVTSSSQYWEKQEADLYVPVPWENNSIHCIVTIFVSCTRLENSLQYFDPVVPSEFLCCTHTFFGFFSSNKIALNNYRP